MNKQVAIPFGVLDFYDHYVVFLVTCDRITKDIAVEILRHTDAHYGDSPYVFISNRVFTSRVDPQAYSVVDASKLVGVAIVSEEEEAIQKARVERNLYEGSFGTFDNLEDAKAWAVAITSQSAD